MSQQQAVLPFNQSIPNEFSQFIGNESVLKVLQRPDELPQFVYLWGEQYTGKTHLLNAEECLLLANNNVVLSLQAEQLLSIDVVSILPEATTHLLLDNISKLAGYSTGELALFNLFNHCKSQHIKLITSASFHPKASVWQLPDLISRLTSGLTLALEPLKGRAAFACLEKQFEHYGVPLDESVIQYIQTHCSSAFPELYQLFLSVAGESLKLKRKVTVPLIKHAINSGSTDTSAPIESKYQNSEL